MSEARTLTISSSTRLFPALALLLATSLLADDGDPDLTFSSDGQTTYIASSPAVAGERGSAVAALADGSLLIGGTSWGGPGNATDFAVARYLANGTVDTQFGSFGSTIVEQSGSDYLEEIFVESNGRILLAGRALNAPALARLTEGGDLDGTFGSGGTVVVEPPSPSAEVLTYERRLRRDGSGRIYFVGRCRLCPANESFRPFVLRLESDGDPDPTFDGDGWAILPVDLGDNPRLALDLDAYGRPLVAVENAAPVSIWRLTGAGTPDAAWGGGDGHVETAFTTGNPFDLLADPSSDRIYLYNSFAVRAVLPTGSLDVDFGDEGVTLLNDWDEGSSVRRLALQSDGKLLGVGTIDPVGTGSFDFFLLRLGLDGLPDPTFHGNGVRRVPFDLATGAIDGAEALSLSAGRPVVVGYATEGDGDERWAILRTENALIFADGFERGSSSAWTALATPGLP
jgi:uncharacterized delta-60 repeat protein